MHFTNKQLFSEVFSDPALRDKVAFVYHDTPYTYDEIRRAVELCASDLIRIGVQPTDHVALWAYNSVNWFITMLAIVRVGGVAVLLNYSMLEEHCARMADFSDVEYVAYGQNRETQKNPIKSMHLAEKVGFPGHLYNMWDIDFKARLAAGEQPIDLPEENKDPDRAALIIFTTGTTALPKAVMISQRSVLSNAIACDEHIQEALDHEHVLLSLPLFHSYGLTVSFAFLLLGKTVHFHEKLKPDVMMDLISRYRIGIVCSVGLLYLGMLQSPEFPQKVAPYTRLCIVGGEFVNPAQIISVHQMYPEIAFAVGYGQTEAGPVIALNHPFDPIERRAYSVGKPLPNVRIRIVDADTKQELGVGESGEVQIKSDSMMNEYYHVIPEKQAIDSEGWLHTGDLGYLDPDGYLYLTGRIKDIIIKNGENISPMEIENALIRCPGIKSARVVGLTVADYGEEIEACLVMNPGATFEEEKVREQLLHYVNKLKVPEHFFVFNEFPLCGNGKIDVRALKEYIAHQLGVQPKKA